MGRRFSAGAHPRQEPKHPHDGRLPCCCCAFPPFVHSQRHVTDLKNPAKCDIRPSSANLCQALRLPLDKSDLKQDSCLRPPPALSEVHCLRKKIIPSVCLEPAAPPATCSAPNREKIPHRGVRVMTCSRKVEGTDLWETVRNWETLGND